MMMAQGRKKPAVGGVGVVGFGGGGCFIIVVVVVIVLVILVVVVVVINIVVVAVCSGLEGPFRLPSGPPWDSHQPTRSPGLVHCWPHV